MISINATLIVQIINLLVLIFILNKIMYRPVREIMARRAQQIEQGKAEAEAMRQKAQADKEAFERELFLARKKVREELARLRLEAENKARAIIDQAQEQAKQKDAELSAEISRQIEKARQDIRQEAETVARSMAAAVLGREVA